MKFQVTIQGIAPLLMHKFSEEALEKPSGARGGRQKLDKEQKEDIAKYYLYTDSKGKLVQPGIHIEMGMAKAASEFRLAGAGKKTYKETIQSACFVTPEYIPHSNQKWIVDARATVNQTTKGRMMSYRPRLDTWELSFVIEVLDDRADPEVIKAILEYTGLRKGIGSYRPRFGRFTVKSFKQLKK